MTNTEPTEPEPIPEPDPGDGNHQPPHEEGDQPEPA